MHFDSSKVRYLYKKQHQEHARWLLLAALAREYPQHVEPLLAAKKAFEEEMGPRDQDPQVGRVFQMHILRTSFIPRLEDESSPPDWRLGSHSPLSLAVAQWAKATGLMFCSGYEREQVGRFLKQKVYTYQPAPWTGEFGLKLLEAQVYDAQSVEHKCLHFSEPYQLSFVFEHETKEHEESYPKLPNLSAFVPSFHSKKEFLAETARKLEAYADEMLLWVERKGKTAETQRRATDRHYRWLAWYLCEQLKPDEIANRETERPGGTGKFLDETTVRKALFGSNGLVHLTGFVKETH